MVNNLYLLQWPNTQSRTQACLSQLQEVAVTPAAPGRLRIALTQPLRRLKLVVSAVPPGSVILIRRIKNLSRCHRRTPAKPLILAILRVTPLNGGFYSNMSRPSDTFQMFSANTPFGGGGVPHGSIRSNRFSQTSWRQIAGTERRTKANSQIRRAVARGRYDIVAFILHRTVRSNRYNCTPCATLLCTPWLRSGQSCR